MVIFFQNGADKVIIEIEPDACCAYYLSASADAITGDVWLFNIGETPVDPPWAGSEEWDGPYQNSSEFCYPHNIPTPVVGSDFDVDFHESNDTAGIYFREYLVGILADHWRPGKSSFARLDSPVAKKMEREIDRPT
jgi:hypothetical protein